MAIPSTSVERRRIRAWQMYDWADSGFATVILAAVLPVYFGLSQQIRGQGQSATAVWGAANAISMLFVAIAALTLGPASDRMAGKKRALAVFIAIGAISTAAIAFSPLHLWWLMVIFYIIGNLGFGGGNIFYDALLPAVAPRNRLDHVSSGGYALGYIGGGVLLAFCVFLIFAMPQQMVVMDSAGLQERHPLPAMRISFILVAVWWVLFSIPLFRVVPEPPPCAIEGDASRSAWETLRNVIRYRDLFKFLVAFWFYSDGVGTIVKMAAIYGTEVLGRTNGNVSHHLIGTLLLVQFCGVPFTLIWPRIAERVGTKPAILICLFIYACICVLGYNMSEIWHFYALGLAVASVQGGTQALSRSLFARLVPTGREAEFFGFYNISGKFAGIVGPLLFPILTAMGASSRDVILALIAFFAIGGGVLAAVKIPSE